MTTIAYDGISLCADTLSTSGGTRVGHREKIIKISNGFIAGAGERSSITAIIKWVDGGMTGAGPDVAEGVECIWVDNGGIAWMIDDRMVPFKASIPCATGSGADFALSALTLGFGSKKAIELAILLDCYSGGDVQEVFLSS